MTIKRKLTFTSDPGHGWLSVSHKDLITLGVADLISKYSYMNAKRAFLEEDCDLAIFTDAAEAAGWEITVKDSYTNNRGKPRSLASYDAYWVHNPFGLGSKLRTHGNDGDEFMVIGESGNGKNWRIALTGRGTAMYAVNKSNPLARIRPPAT